MAKISLGMVSSTVSTVTTMTKEQFTQQLSGIVGKGKRIKFMNSIVGTLSDPSKMPCFSYSIPAKHCQTGSKLRLVKGSTCSDCYAMKGRYPFPNVQNAMNTRFDSLGNLDLWEVVMIELIKETYSGNSTSFDQKYFRWHDSGDLQSVPHLQAIANIAKALPDILFWLPTREYPMVSYYLKNNNKPDNLTIRLSAHMIGKAIDRPMQGTTSSSVESGNGHICPASKQENTCRDCRACWHVNNVDYVQH
jgi:hypothetical protein